MELKFFDCTCGFGPYRVKVHRFARTADDLLAEMDWCGIDEALVYHTAMRFDGPAVGNARVSREAADHPRLHVTWTVLPSATGEQPDVHTLVKEMAANDVRALRLYPEDHRYFLDDITWGDQIAVYQEKHVPLIIKASLDKIRDLLRAFPNLIVITDTQGSNPLDRFAWPLIEKFPNLYYETSGYLVDTIFEEFCRRYGAKRLLFSSGTPDHAAGAAQLMLAHADISDSDKQDIAAGNLSRLLAEVKLP